MFCGNVERGVNNGLHVRGLIPGLGSPAKVPVEVDATRKEKNQHQCRAADDDHAPDPLEKTFEFTGQRLRTLRVRELGAALRALGVLRRHPVPATVALDFIPLRRVALRAQALDVLDRGGAAEVEREYVVVVDELSHHSAVLAALVVARVHGPLDVFRDVAAGLLGLRL